MIYPGLLQDGAFVSTWNTENAGSVTKTIVIPTSATGTYACTVDWGDGKTNYITTYNDAAWTHLYAATGSYTIKIYGKFIGLVFNNLGDKLKLMSIRNWGRDFAIGTNQGSYFSGCSNLTISATDCLNLSGCTTLYQMFNSCSALTTVPGINSWNTSGITSISQTFKGAASFNQNLTTFNTQNVTTMSDMFYGCTAFNGSVAGFNTANVTLMLGVFYQCTAFNQSVANFNTANVTQMNSLFNGCTAFNQSVANFSTANVTNMINMFNSCPTFNQSVANFSTANVTNMSNMFLNCTAFNQNVATFIIAKVTAAVSMFSGSGFSTANYNLLLNSTTGWPSQATILSNVSFHAGTAHYSTGSPTTGRALLTGTKLWTITDGGTP